MPSTSSRVLVAPLNWGLGHATRCIPVIKQLMSLGCEVIIAAEGAASHLLKNEFPSLQHLTTPGKTIQYGKSGIGFFFSMLWQIPSLWRQVKNEQNWIKEIVDRYQPQLIITDNRYGLHHKNVPSVIITHQLGIRSGLGKIADGLLQLFLYQLLNKFNEVWVPDHQGKASLAGSLSHPLRMPNTPVFYIGPLNRFAEFNPVLKNKADTPENPSLLILLSGPEPQRSLLENLLKKQLIDHAGKVTLLRGLPTKSETSPLPSAANHQLPLYYGTQNFTILDHLPPKELLEKIFEAEIILCRSGYTSLMELLPLQKKLILIPTPGQAEQEYLANYCNEKGWAICATQKRLVLPALINIAKAYAYKQADNAPRNTRFMEERVRFYLRSLS
jgi:predicted glycosyltransferase